MKRPQITHHTGKGDNHEILPNRHALNTLTGDPAQRSINDYSKRTPTIVQNGPDIRSMGLPK